MTFDERRVAIDALKATRSDAVANMQSAADGTADAILDDLTVDNPGGVA